MSVQMPVAQYRRFHQHNRIAEGVQSGELTRKEAKELRTDQKDIRGQIKDAKADGVVTTDERQAIRQAQNAASKDIYQSKHDAQDRGATPRVDARQANQRERIGNGMASGELTAKETADLVAGRQEIRQAERTAKADGVVTAPERQQLQGMLNDYSKDIFEAKHNKKRNPFV
jgi:uncharacterized membrane protein YebE (DUF533 family)